MSHPNLPFLADSAIPADATPDLARLKGKSVVVTGGTSGIGEAMTRAFVAAGAFVTIGDVADDRGAALVAELGPENAVFVHCDVLVWAEQVALFKTAIARAPARAVDIVCANAGIATPDDLFPSEAEKADPDADPVEPKLATLKVNLLGMAYTSKLAMHYLPRQPAGDEANRDRSFILTASMAGYLDHPGAPQYNASKWGTRGLFRSFRSTMPTQGIRVGIIAPWFVRTRIVPEQAKQYLDHVAKIEWAEVEDAASAALLFASNPKTNGRALHIVPRSIDPRGYVDLQLDDSEVGQSGAGWKLNLGITKA